MWNRAVAPKMGLTKHHQGDKLTSIIPYKYIYIYQCCFVADSRVFQRDVNVIRTCIKVDNILSMLICKKGRGIWAYKMFYTRPGLPKFYFTCHKHDGLCYVSFMVAFKSKLCTSNVGCVYTRAMRQAMYVQTEVRVSLNETCGYNSRTTIRWLSFFL